MVLRLCAFLQVEISPPEVDFLVLGGKVRRLVVVGAVAALLLFVFPVAVFAAGGAAPSGLSVGLPDSSAGGCLKLTWPVEQPSLVREFRVFRSEKPDSGFKQVFSGPVESYRLNIMEYVDTGLADGGTYYYKVALIGDGGTKIATTDVASGTLPRKAAAMTGGLAGKRIIVSITDQTIYFLENEVLVKSHLCSTGTVAKPTPEGVFSVLYHDYCAVSRTYGGVYCYWWMGFAPDAGMHALPYNPKTGQWTSASCLGHRASHGCIRQSVADAEWAYRWAPNGTRIDIISQHYDPPPPPPTAPPPIKGGHASQGISKASKTWYLAEGCTSGSFDEFVLMMNPNPTTANVDASFMKPDGSVVPEKFAVPPLSRYTVHVNTIAGLENTEVSTMLSADQPIAAERSMYFDYGGRAGGSDSAGVTEPAKTWYLAEGYTGGDFDEFVLVQNPGDIDAAVHVVYMRPDGPNVLKDYSVKAHSRFSIHVDDAPELASAEVSTKVKSSQPVIVERSQYFNYYGRDDGNASAGITSPALSWYLAEGYTGGDFDEYVLVQNPGDQAAKVNVTFMCSDGRNVPYKFAMAPKTRHTIHVDEVPGLESAEVSTRVEADQPIVAERSMYFVSYGRPGGSDAPGVADPATYWYLPEGYTGGDFDTYVLIMNPNDEAVTVDASYLKPGGATKTAQYVIAPRSRYTVHLDAIDGLSNTEVATALTAADGKTVICERAMYFSFPRK
jgi:lipoprotein-anchoring transpeptidase ErfK/SrfK